MEDFELDTDEKVTGILSDAFMSVNEAFVDNVPDYQHSGATCTAAMLNGHRIYSANCGDARAILVSKHRRITVLTNDHKLEVPSEKQRCLE
jgi:serine/threonine protein phosphatase PrpC